MNNRIVTLYPLGLWPNQCPEKFGKELFDLVQSTGSLDTRVLRLAARQRELKAALAATGVPDALCRDALAGWTEQVFLAEDKLRRHQGRVSSTADP